MVILFLNTISGMLCVTLLGQGIGGYTQVGLFQKKKGELATSSSDTFVHAKSKLHCATMCSSDETCVSFAYSKGTKYCEMANEKVPGLEKSVYVKTTSAKKTCPTEMGYKRWNYTDMTLCLKYDSTEQLNQQETVERCNQDGGHLVLVDSDSKRSRIVQAVQEIGVTPTDTIFIDGYDGARTGVFHNWKEEEMVWLSWYSSREPNGGGYCMVTRLSLSFLLADGKCDTLRNYFLCEIDVSE